MIIRLDNNQECSKICETIQKIVNKEIKLTNTLENKALSIMIVDIINPPPSQQLKLEHKP
jgi:uncharacterized alkaline shock family protein YloU